MQKGWEGMENRRLGSDRVFRQHYRFIFYAGFTLECVYVFNILDACRVHARAHADTPMHISLAEHSAEHGKLAFPRPLPHLPPWFAHRPPPALVLHRVLPSFLSFLHKSAIFYPFSSSHWSLFLSHRVFFSAPLPSPLLPPLACLARASNILASFPRAFSFPCLLALRDPLKSLSLCFSRHSFSRATPPT